MKFVVIVRVKTQKKGVLVEEGGLFLAFRLEQHVRETRDKQITVIFDFTDAGVTNLVNNTALIVKRTVQQKTKSA